MKNISLLYLILLLLPVISFAQENDLDMHSGIFEPGNTFSMMTFNKEPICWINKANELNIYLEMDTGINLYTITNNGKPIALPLPKFDKVTVTQYNIVLQSADNNYYYGVESKEEKQMKQMVKYTVLEFTKTFSVTGIARHKWPKTEAKITLQQLQAANSVNEVLGKE
jgi:hypothetical protein